MLGNTQEKNWPVKNSTAHYTEQWKRTLLLKHKAQFSKLGPNYCNNLQTPAEVDYISISILFKYLDFFFSVSMYVTFVSQIGHPLSLC